MACIDNKFCRICKEKTQHVSYPDNYYSDDEGCQQCWRRINEERREKLENKKNSQQSNWEEMTLEEKVEDLNTRLREQEVNNMTF